MEDKEKIHVFQEGGRYISYCPALDLSACGETYSEAVRNFYEMFELYLDCCNDFGTLQKELSAMSERLARLRPQRQKRHS